MSNVNNASTSVNPNKGVIAWFINNPVASNLLMIFIVILGLASSNKLSKAITPEYNISAINISVIYPGAGPAEVENGIVLKIEEAIQNKSIAGIKRISSTSRESVANTLIEVTDDIDINNLANEVKLAIDSIENLPAASEKPVIEKITQSIQALNIQIHGAGLSEVEGKRLLHEVKNDLLSMDGLSSVKLRGDKSAEIAIEISENNLRKYGLTFGQIASAIDASSIDFPAGALKTANGDLLLRAKGRAFNVEDFKNIPLIAKVSGERILLGDIAHVRETFEETLNSNLFDGEYSVGIGVFAVDDEDIIQIAKMTKEYIDGRQATLPNGIHMTYWGETVVYLEQRLDMMYENLFVGVILVLISLAMFMNLAIAFWVMIGIPVCFLGALIFLPTFGVTINLISLFGFILVLGIVVDDAIIIGESAHSSMKAENSKSVDTILRGIHRVSTPAVFGVLTTVCAFLPTIFITGKWANFPAACGYVVIFCLLFSLIESKFILPSHIAHSGSISNFLNFKWQNKLQQNSNRILDNFVKNSYQPFLKKAVNNRYITISAFFALLILTIAAVQVGFVRYVLTPEVPSDYLRASLKMPEGTSNAEVKRASQQVLDGLKKLEKKYKQEIGLDETFVKHSISSNKGTISKTTIEVLGNTQRKISNSDIQRRWKEETGKIIGATSLVFSDAQDEDVGISGDIAYKLSSSNQDHLFKAAKELKAELLKYDGVTSSLDGVPESVDELQFKLTPNGEALGLNLASIGNQVREAFYGAEARRIQREDNEVKVKIRYPASERKNLSDLNDMYVRTANGVGTPLQSVADLTIKQSQVSKVRVNGEQALTVTAKIDKAFAEPKIIAEDMESKMKPALQKKYPTLKFEAAGASKDDAEMEGQLLIGFALSLLGIYALLAIPLKSYSQPFIIMSVIPFGVIGAIIGHKIMGMALSMMSIFGIIALAGVVVNDSLIMVGFINDARQKGKDIMTGIIESGSERFRAIFLTSLTTFLGVFPILLETSVQAQFVIPMATSLGFGIIFATIITLILIPCFYMMLDDLSKTKMFLVEFFNKLLDKTGRKHEQKF